MLEYQRYIGLLKAISDTNRLMIVNMLSCGEICACKILEKLEITQPTLSHHMKVLGDCGLVNGRREGKWIYYSLNKETVERFKAFFDRITTNKSLCVNNLWPENDSVGQLNDEQEGNCASYVYAQPKADNICNQGG